MVELVRHTYYIGPAPDEMEPVLVEFEGHEKTVERGQRIGYSTGKKTVLQWGAGWRRWKGWLWCAQEVAQARPGRTYAELKELFGQGVIYFTDSAHGGTASLESAKPLDLIIVIDRSGSMLNAMQTAKDAATVLVNSLDPRDHRAALISYSDQITLNAGLTHNLSTVTAAIASLQAQGGTWIGTALQRAMQHMADEGRPEARHVIVLMSDGVNGGGANPIIAAEDAKEAGNYIYTIGLGSGINQAEMTLIATTPEDFYLSPTAELLGDIYREVAQDIGGVVPLRVHWRGNFTVQWEQPSCETAWIAFEFLDLDGYVSRA